MGAKKYPCVYMRGGTSKALVFHKKDLPAEQALWPALFMKMMGTPDKKQIDGMGGAVTSTSKVAVISPSAREDADVDYHFFQVAVDTPDVHDRMNCGNISSVVGPFAVDEGLVAVVEPITVVRIYNVNTGKLLEEHVRVQGGRAMTDGEAAIQGVPGTGAPIDLFFVDPAGATTGRAFPTGNRSELLEVPGYAPIEATMMDCVNPVVFIRAGDIGLRGTELTELNENAQVMAHLERIRCVASEKMGFVESWQEAAQKRVAAPLIAMVSPPCAYADLEGNHIDEDAMDLCCRGLTGGRLHRAYPMSMAVATGAASKLEGTIVHGTARASSSAIVRLGHVSGCTGVDVRIRGDRVEKVSVVRTARRIMEGYLYVEGNIISTK